MFEFEQNKKLVQQGHPINRRREDKQERKNIIFFHHLSHNWTRLDREQIDWFTQESRSPSFAKRTQNRLSSRVDLMMMAMMGREQLIRFHSSKGTREFEQIFLYFCYSMLRSPRSGQSYVRPVPFIRSFIGWSLVCSNFRVFEQGNSNQLERECLNEESSHTKRGPEFSLVVVERWTCQFQSKALFNQKQKLAGQLVKPRRRRRRKRRRIALLTLNTPTKEEEESFPPIGANWKWPLFPPWIQTHKRKARESKPKSMLLNN